MKTPISNTARAFANAIAKILVELGYAVPAETTALKEGFRLAASMNLVDSGIADTEALTAALKVELGMVEKPKSNTSSKKEKTAKTSDDFVATPAMMAIVESDSPKNAKFRQLFDLGVEVKKVWRLFPDGEADYQRVKNVFKKYTKKAEKETSAK